MPKYSYRPTEQPKLTRIDMLLGLYDAALQRITDARRLLGEGKTLQAEAALLRVERIVLELFAGVKKDGSELSKNLSSLYLYVLDALTRTPVPDLDSAERVLRTLYSAWQNIADEARERELRGEIPPVTECHTFDLSA